MSHSIAAELMTPELQQGIAQFNQGEFYACHDTLEALWIQAEEQDKKFYQGILQVAVALYHLGNGNWRGAVILMGEGLNRLQSYLPHYADLDLEAFTADVADILSTLQTLGADRVGDLQLIDPEIPSEPVVAEGKTEDNPEGKVQRSRPILQLLSEDPTSEILDR